MTTPGTLEVQNTMSHGVSKNFEPEGLKDWEEKAVQHFSTEHSDCKATQSIH